MSVTKGNREVPRPKNRAGKIVLIVIGVIAALALIGIAAWKALVVPPDVSENGQSGVPSQTDGAESSNDGSNASDTPVSTRKQDFYTFILLGKDTGGGGNTDTMLLVSYDVPNGTVDLVSIPRDTMINVSWNIKKINAVYASSRGIEGLKEEIDYLTGVKPDFYVAIEWEAIGEIVEALDGVWFDVPFDMNYDDPYQDLYIHQEKGYRLLNGDDAMQVIRYRKNNGEKYGIGDTGRQQVQQDFLKAVAKQCLQIQNWTKVSAFAEIFFENIETDIPLNNLLWFAQQAMGLNMENINFHSLPGNDEGWYYTPSIKGNLAYFFADPAGIVELINAHFNPYSVMITEEDLSIVYKNKDASLGVTNGELADPSMAIPSVKPPSTPKPDSGESGTPAPDEGSEPAHPENEEPPLPDEPSLPDGGEGERENETDSPSVPDAGDDSGVDAGSDTPEEPVSGEEPPDAEPAVPDEPPEEPESGNNENDG